MFGPINAHVNAKNTTRLIPEKKTKKANKK
jgi:hypothetical protein